MQRGKDWEPAVVTAIHSSPRCYVVQHGGQVLQRNSRHLPASKKPMPVATPELDDLDGVLSPQDLDPDVRGQAYVVGDLVYVSYSPSEIDRASSEQYDGAGNMAGRIQGAAAPI